MPTNQSNPLVFAIELLARIRHFFMQNENLRVVGQVAETAVANLDEEDIDLMVDFLNMLGVQFNLQRVPGGTFMPLTKDMPLVVLRMYIMEHFTRVVLADKEVERTEKKRLEKTAISLTSSQVTGLMATYSVAPVLDLEDGLFWYYDPETGDPTTSLKPRSLKNDVNEDKGDMTV